MIAFPSNPTVGQTFTVGVRSWKWNGVAWDMLAISDTQVVRAENAADRAEAAALTIGTTAAFSDANPVVKGNVDATKQLRFEVDGLTSGTTRVITIPDKDGTLATTADITDVILVASIVPTAVAAIDLPNVFPGTYDYYEILIKDIAHTNNQVDGANNVTQMRLITDGSTVNTSNVYFYSFDLAANTSSTYNHIPLTQINGSYIEKSNITIRVFRGDTTTVDVVGISKLTPQGISHQVIRIGATLSNVTGFRIYPRVGSFLAGGTIHIYGYRKN